MGQGFIISHFNNRKKTKIKRKLKRKKLKSGEAFVRKEG